jgi:hypothetical protein
MNAPFHELSDGLERSPPGEGADVAPDWTDVQEDNKKEKRPQTRGVCGRSSKDLDGAKLAPSDRGGMRRFRRRSL